MSDPGMSCLDSPYKRAHCLAEDWEAGSLSRVPPQLLSWGHGLLQAARSPRLGKRWWYWWYQGEPGYFPNRRSLLPSGRWGDFVSPELVPVAALPTQFYFLSFSFIAVTPPCTSCTLSRHLLLGDPTPHIPTSRISQIRSSADWQGVSSLAFASRAGCKSLHTCLSMQMPEYLESEFPEVSGGSI